MSLAFDVILSHEGQSLSLCHHSDFDAMYLLSQDPVNQLMRGRQQEDVANSDGNGTNGSKPGDKAAKQVEKAHQRIHVSVKVCTLFKNAPDMNAIVKLRTCFGAAYRWTFQRTSALISTSKAERSTMV